MTGINDLRVGINQVLDANFPDIIIYGEEVKQGFEEPCFFIKTLSSGQGKELNTKYRKNISFDIHYFSDKEDVNSDCNDMADKFYEILDYVSVNGSLYKPSNMNHEVIDGVLHFMLQFNYRVVKEVEASPKMNTLETEVSLKNG